MTGYATTVLPSGSTGARQLDAWRDESYSNAARPWTGTVTNRSWREAIFSRERDGSWLVHVKATA